MKSAAICLLLVLATGGVSFGAVQDGDVPSVPPVPLLRVGDRLAPIVRPRIFPLKRARTLFSDPEIKQLRDNVTQHAAARRTADRIVKDAGYWLDWSDAALRELVTTAEVPRAFDCSPAGCPVHGKKIFEAARNTYPWNIDPKSPFTVTCPVGGESYPSNDYGRFYRSGFTERSDFDGPYVDDGRGWLAPDGQRYWFVAHANHWTWHQAPGRRHNLFAACDALGRAYLITGDERYAHQAAVLLHRIAEVYPAMDHESQSRFGEMMRASGQRYPGKVVNSIWEGQLVAKFAETYDAVWDRIDADRELQRLVGRSGAEIRGFIEANLLEDGIDAYYARKLRGNYGMHQRALLTLAIVRQTGANERYLTDIVDRPQGDAFLGLKYALTNLVWCDGQPHESPGYNRLWVRNLASVAALLPRLGRDLSTLPRMRRLFDSPLEATVIGRYTPAIGDSFSVYGGLAADDPAAYRTALQLYGDPRYAELLADERAGGEKEFSTFESLLEPPLGAPVAAAPAFAAGRRVRPQPSRLLSGYGLSVLNNPADAIAATVYHGLHVSHAHYDRLNLELFAHGQPMLPDLGYGDAMNTFVPGIYTWTKSTIAHNTVTVDARRQVGNEPGVLELQAGADWARACIASAPGTYPQCDVYRRSVVMVDVDDGHSYAVDIFDVRGGRQHDYSLHGPPGAVALTDSDWSEPARGTLAGEDVALGQIYDDAKLGAPNYTGGYAGYRGSGFQHLAGVRRLQRGAGVVTYTHEKNSQARLALRVLPQAGQELLFAQARVSPVKFPQLLGYVIARRATAAGRAETEPLRSRFVAVLEPFATEPMVESATRIDFADAVVVAVSRRDGKTDLVVVGDSDERRRVRAAGREFETGGRVTVASFERSSGKWERVWLSGPGRFSAEGAPAVVADAWRGEVVSVDVRRSVVRLRVGSRPPATDPSALAGQVVHFGAGRRTVNIVKAARAVGEFVELELRDDVVVGLVNVSGVAPSRIATGAGFVFAATYGGATLVNRAGEALGVVARAGDGFLETRAPLDAGLIRPGEDVWIASVGAGDGGTMLTGAAWRR